MIQGDKMQTRKPCEKTQEVQATGVSLKQRQLSGFTYREVTGESQEPTSPKKKILRKEQAKNETLGYFQIQKGTKAREGGKAATLEKDWSGEPDN